MRGGGILGQASANGLFYGWIIVGAAFTVFFAAYGLQFAYGVYFPHMVADLGWSRAAASAPYSVYVLVYSLLSATSGRITDSRGPRVVVTGGGTLLGLGYLGLSQSIDPWHVYISFGIVAGVGMSAAFIPLSATVSKWFVRRRGTAVNLSGLGISVSNFLGPAAAAALLLLFDWRISMMIGALFGATVIVLAASLLRRDPESIGQRPDGETGRISETPNPRICGEEKSWVFSEARRTLAFWLILGLFVFAWLMLFAPYVHLPAHAQDIGLSETTGAGLLSMAGIGAVVGRLSIGLFVDRLGTKFGLGTALFAQIFALIGLAMISHAVGLFAAVIFLGYASVMIVVYFSVLVAETFGRAHVGEISGFLFAIAGGGASAGPYIAGYVFDVTGSYVGAFLLDALLVTIALFLMLFIREPQKTDSDSHI